MLENGAACSSKNRRLSYLLSHLTAIDLSLRKSADMAFKTKEQWHPDRPIFGYFLAVASILNLTPATLYIVTRYVQAASCHEYS